MDDDQTTFDSQNSAGPSVKGDRPTKDGILADLPATATIETFSPRLKYLYPRHPERDGLASATGLSGKQKDQKV